MTRSTRQQKGSPSPLIAAGVRDHDGGRRTTTVSNPAGTVDELLMLVNRTTVGFTENAYSKALQLGYDGWIEYQLDHLALEDTTVESLLASYPSLGMSGAQLYTTFLQGGANVTVPLQDLRIAAALRATYSNRQLFERMVEFWTDHFNIWQGLSSAVTLLKTVDDRDVIRTHALGNFQDMVHASSTSGAMIRYLDNFSNVVGSPNENYARELMELHTLGVDGPYTEHDVRELARCFTGWRHSTSPSNWGEFLFDLAYHDTGQKVLLGKTIPAGGGVLDAKVIIKVLVEHPATANFVARKMTAWLLGYDPPQPLVDQVANVYLTTQGDIKDMIRAILHPAHVLTSVPWDQRKHKRPLHFLVGLVRQVQPTITAPLRLVDELTLLGQRPFNRLPPDGYPDTIDAWGSDALPRWSFAARLLDNQIPGVTVDTATVTGLLGGAPRAMWAQRINDFMLGGSLSAAEQAKVQSYIDNSMLTPDALAREAIALVASSPGYQYY